MLGRDDQIAARGRLRGPVPTAKCRGSGPTLPNGNYVVRRGRITAIHKDPPDLEKLAKAFLYLAEQLTQEDAERRDKLGSR